jgi:hypothetical protein
MAFTHGICNSGYRNLMCFCMFQKPVIFVFPVNLILMLSTNENLLYFQVRNPTVVLSLVANGDSRVLMN